ncbi:MAG: hypothetical protein JJU05_13545 [Verrucomicrobia bacterium]|nr:hypothetical protein [Verrucomicrobiota bacterium]MCH8527460.1 hypothetical protein [Kiritimatiellia bacterium]
MKYLSLIHISVLVFIGSLLSSCTGQTKGVQKSLEDGTYRGGFMDEGTIQVNLEFTLESGIVTEASFRHLVGADPAYYLDVEDEPYRSVVRQYDDALQHLVGKPLLDHLPDLYHPETIVRTEVDGYSAATIRSNKIISSIRDALNRGVYSY